MDNLPKDLDEGVMKELECPVCFEYMKPPISMCENGHSICNDCKPKLKNCPSCRKSFLDVRNLALESLSAALASPNNSSKNSDSSHKNYKCPFAAVSNEDCVWCGSLLDMKNHIMTSHGDGNDTHESTGRFNVILTNLSSERHYRKVVSIGDELFYVVWEIKDGSFFCSVLYVGPKKKSSKFTYTFSITTENGPKKISMSFQTQSVVKSIENVFTPGDCVLLHYDTVLKFLNSNKYLLCDFEINPIETVSGVGKDHLWSGRSIAVTGGSDCFRVKREFVGKQTSPNKSEFPGSYNSNSCGACGWSGRAGRRGRGNARGRFVRGGRRGAAERSVESYCQTESKPRGFEYRGGLPGKHSKMGRSLTDLRDEANYEAGIDTLRTILHETRLKANSSSVLSAAKKVPINRHKSISGLDKSQDSVRENGPKVKSAGSSSANYVPSDELTKVCALKKSKDKIQTDDSEVKSPSSEQFTIVSASGKSLNNVQADGPLVRWPANSATVKCAPSKNPNKVSELGKLQDNFQARDPKVKSSSNLPTSKCGPSDQVTDVPELGKARYNIQSIYPKLDSSDLSPVDNYYSSPFDTLHDQAQANDAKVMSCPNASTVRDTLSFQSTNLLPFLTNNQTDTSNSSKETWKCFLCGQFAPLKQRKHNLPLLDIAPPGANQKCKLCGQWRP
jgi:E3 ubiquitin-protein ligase SIAH1